MVIGSSKRKFVVVPPLEGVGKQVASSKVRKKSVALRPLKDQRKPVTSSSSLDEEQPFTVLAHSSPKKKKSVIPPSGAFTHTRSKSASIIKRTIVSLFFFSFFFFLFFFFFLTLGIETNLRAHRLIIKGYNTLLTTCTKIDLRLCLE